MAVQLTYQQGSCKAHSLYFCTSCPSYSIYYCLFMIIAVIVSIYDCFNQEIMLSVKKQIVSLFLQLLAAVI